MLFNCKVCGNVYSALIAIPGEWDYSIPYGLLYAHDAPDDVLRFVETIRKNRGTKE
ncbi:MAG: hypothetical protein HP008_06460 [Clostridia bacterium]|nr:hypothetical protein [Clostridia bacterium]